MEEIKNTKWKRPYKITLNEKGLACWETIIKPRLNKIGKYHFPNGNNKEVIVEAIGVSENYLNKVEEELNSLRKDGYLV